MQLSAARLAAAAAAAVLALGPGCLPSQAVTSEQLLFLEAWRAVDRAYVDKSFNGQNWFKVCGCWGRGGSCAERQQLCYEPTQHVHTLSS